MSRLLDSQLAKLELLCPNNFECWHYLLTLTMQSSFAQALYSFWLTGEPKFTSLR